MQLGKAFSVLVVHHAAEAMIYADLHAYSAPSECYKDVEKGEIERYRLARRKAKATSGLNRRMFNLAVKALPTRAWDRALNERLARISPFHR
jgi:hypothetical protein